MDSGPRACRTQACPLIGFQPRLHGFQVQGVRGGVRDYPGRDFTGLRDRVGLSRRVSVPSGEKSSLYHEQGSRCSSSPGGRGRPAGGAETPSGGWHAGAEDQSPERGLRPAGRPGPCSFTTLCASCTESLWETWPFPLARLWLVRNPAFTCQSGPQGAPVRALDGACPGQGLQRAYGNPGSGRRRALWNLHLLQRDEQTAVVRQL